MNLGGIALATLAVVSPARRARAQEIEPPTRVEVADCADFITAEALEKALGVELRAAGPEVLAYIEREDPRARVRCRDRTVTIQLATSGGVEFRETLDSDRPGLVRFIAIAIAESIAARAQAELEASEPAPPIIEKPSPSRPRVEAPAEPPRDSPSADDAGATSGVWLNALGGAQGAGRPAWWSGQGELMLELVSRGLFAFSTTVTGSRGVTQVVEGRVAATTGSLALAVRIGSNLSAFRLEAGVGARAGFVLWEGLSDSPAVVGLSGAAPWGGPLGELLIAAQMAPNVRLLLGSEGGVTLLSATASRGGTVVAELAPVWFAAKLGLGLRLAPWN